MTQRDRKTHYEVLQVDRQATPAVIQGAYRALLKTAHPDLGGSRSDAQALNEAFSILSDPVARRSYDRELEALHPALGFQPPVVRTQYILICPGCRKRNLLGNPEHLERARCGSCDAALMPRQRMAMATDHARAFRLGIYLFDKGLLPRSRSEFEAAVRLQPRNPKYHYWLGRCLYQMRGYERARQAFQAAATLAPRRFHYRFWLGQIQYALREYHEAAGHFMVARRIRPRHAPTLLRLASCFFHLGDYPRAVRVLEAAIGQDPRRLQLYTLLGVVYLASRDRGAALQAFRHAEQLNPGDALTRRYLNLIQGQGAPSG